MKLKLETSLDVTDALYDAHNRLRRGSKNIIIPASALWTLLLDNQRMNAMLGNLGVELDQDTPIPCRSAPSSGAIIG